MNTRKMKLAAAAALLGLIAAGCSTGAPAGAPTSISQVQGGKEDPAVHAEMMKAIAGQIAHSQTYGGVANGNTKVTPTAPTQQ